MNQLLRRAWDALDSFKQAYPENWHEDDEQVMIGLMKADLKLSDVKLKWVGLTEEEIEHLWQETSPYYDHQDFARAIEAAHGIKGAA